jgi:hypothetical protein
VHATTPSRRLALEALEERAAPAANVWVGPQNGLWSNPANWSLRHAPQTSDSLVFYGPASGIGTPGRNTSSVNDLRSVSVFEVRCLPDYTGTITIGPSTGVTTASSSTFQGQLLLTAGSRITTNGILRVNGGLTVQGPATLATTSGVVTAGNTVITGGGGVAPGLTVSGTYTSAGTLSVGLPTGPSTLAVSGWCNLNGATNVNHFSRVIETAGAPIVIAGQTTMYGAVLTASNVKTVSGGSIVTTDAIDTVAGSLTNSGKLAFGGPAVHAFTVTGSYNQFLGSLWERVGPVGADRLLVRGQADLANGSLNVGLTGVGSVFPGFSAVLVHADGGLKGQFGALSLPPAMPGLRWRYGTGLADFTLFLSPGMF